MSDVPSGEMTAIRCLRADSRLLGQLDFGGMKRCDFWRAKRAENFPHNPMCFPHNQHFLPHNVPENFRIICYFFPHPIRCPVSVGQLTLIQAVFNLSILSFTTASYTCTQGSPNRAVTGKIYRLQHHSLPPKLLRNVENSTG